VDWLEHLLEWFCSHFSPYSPLGQIWNVRALIAVVLACLACSAVGSLVLGNRMAFFSDALAHCAVAGVTLGFLLYILTATIRATLGLGGDFWEWTMPIMIAFGVLVGMGIVWVRQKTGQANDTVIGVFFAGAMGFAAVLRDLIRNRKLFSLEDFLFGQPLGASSAELLTLFVVAVGTAGFLCLAYNSLVFTSFNESLARSRRVRVRVCSYLFIVLLAILVNVCVRTIGALLITALLIVPAATARNLARDMRQLFWLSIGLCLVAGLGGLWLSLVVEIPDRSGDPLKAVQFGISGMIIVLSVLLFAGSIVVGPWLLNRKPVPKAAKP
jgi:zinc transport system permease protein